MDAAAPEQPACARAAPNPAPDRSAFRDLPDELLRRLLAEACAAWPGSPLWGLLAACRVCWSMRTVLAAHPLPAVLRLGLGSGLPEAEAAATEAQAAWLRALAAQQAAPLTALVLGTGVSPKTGAVHVLLGFVVGDSAMLQQLRAWPLRLTVALNPEPGAAAPAAGDPNLIEQVPELDLSAAKLTLLRVANPTPNPAAVDARWLPRALRTLNLELLHADACTALVDLAEWARRLPALDRISITAAAERLALRVGARPGVRVRGLLALVLAGAHTLLFGGSRRLNPNLQTQQPCTPRSCTWRARRATCRCACRPTARPHSTARPPCTCARPSSA